MAIKKRQERPKCLCGCGGTPASKTSKYLPGHDARHHAALRKAGKSTHYLTSEEARAKSRAAQADKRAGIRDLARRDEYAAIVARIEAEGATTSDAQGAADVELHERGLCEPRTCPLHRASRAKRGKRLVSGGE